MNFYKNILGLGFLGISLLGCPTPNGSDKESVIPVEVSITGLESIVDDNYVDLRPDESLFFDVSVSNGSFDYANLEQNGIILDGSYSGGEFSPVSYPSKGFFNVVAYGYNSNSVGQSEVSGLLFGPNDSYLISNLDDFILEYGSISGIFTSGVFGGTIGSEGQYLSSDISLMFDGFSYSDYLSNCEEFRVGKKANGVSYTLGVKDSEVIIFNLTNHFVVDSSKSNYDLVNERDPYNF